MPRVCPNCAEPLTLAAASCWLCRWSPGPTLAERQALPVGGTSCPAEVEAMLEWAYRVSRRTSTARTPPVVSVGEGD